MRVLIDTCVIMDAVQARKPFNKDAEILFLAASNLLFDGFVSAKSMTDIYYLSHRLTHDNVLAKNILSRIASIFDIADTTESDIMAAIASNTTDFEDAVMIETAVREKMDYIITRNPDDFKLSPVCVLSPGEFVHVIADL